MKGFFRCWWASVRYTEVLNRVNVTVFHWFLFAVIGGLLAAGFSLADPPPWGVISPFRVAALITVALLALSFYGAAAAFVAIMCFKEHFDFWPPVTVEGRNALEYAVGRHLAGKAMFLNSVYKQEEQERAGITELAPEFKPEAGLDEAGRRMQQFEESQRSIGRMKRRARRDFYVARNTVGAKYLPWPFSVEKSYKAYLPGKTTAER